MKTQEEIDENIIGCEAKLKESHDNEIKFLSTKTPQIDENYRKTRDYISGWIQALKNLPKGHEKTTEFEFGYNNAIKWLNS